MIALTPAGDTVIEAVQAYKWLLLSDFLRSWAPDELTSFVAQLEHFGEWSGNAVDRESKFRDEIDALARKIELSRPDAVASEAAAG